MNVKLFLAIIALNAPLFSREINTLKLKKQIEALNHVLEEKKALLKSELQKIEAEKGKNDSEAEEKSDKKRNKEETLLLKSSPQKKEIVEGKKVSGSEEKDDTENDNDTSEEPDIRTIKTEEGQKPLESKTNDIKPIKKTDSDLYNHKIAIAQYNQAVTFLNNQELEKAIKAFHFFVKTFPDDSLVPKAYINLGNTYFWNKQFRKACDIYQQAISKTPEKKLLIDAHLGIIRCYEKTGQVDLARIRANYVKKSYTALDKEQLSYLKRFDNVLPPQKKTSIAESF